MCIRPTLLVFLECAGLESSYTISVHLPKLFMLIGLSHLHDIWTLEAKPILKSHIKLEIPKDSSSDYNLWNWDANSVLTSIRGNMVFVTLIFSKCSRICSTEKHWMLGTSQILWHLILNVGIKPSVGYFEKKVRWREKSWPKIIIK